MRRMPNIIAIAYINASANVIPLLNAMISSNIVMKERKSIVFRFNVFKLYHPKP